MSWSEKYPHVRYSRAYTNFKNILIMNSLEFTKTSDYYVMR